MSCMGFLHKYLLVFFSFHMKNYSHKAAHYHEPFLNPNQAVFNPNQWVKSACGSGWDPRSKRGTNLGLLAHNPATYPPLPLHYVSVK